MKLVGGSVAVRAGDRQAKDRWETGGKQEVHPVRGTQLVAASV